jgi:hypothetical protein
MKHLTQTNRFIYWLEYLKKHKPEVYEKTKRVAQSSLRKEKL